MLLLPKSFFQLQEDFAQTMMARDGISPEEAYFHHTAFYVRSIGHSDDALPNSHNPRWQEILDVLLTYPDKVVDIIYEKYMQYEQSKPNDAVPTVCFHTYYHAHSNTYELHFDPIDPKGNLGLGRKEKRLQEFTDMFTQIFLEHKDASLCARTWLFSTEAFCRLFPPEFSGRAQYWKNGNRQYDNTHWGQFVDKEKNVKEELVTLFKKKYMEESHDDYNLYFPLPAKYAVVPLTVCFEYYGVSNAHAV